MAAVSPNGQHNCLRTPWMLPSRASPLSGPCVQSKGSFRSHIARAAFPRSNMSFVMENAMIDISHVGYATSVAEDRPPVAEAGSVEPNCLCETCPFRTRRTVGRPPKDTTEVVVVAAPQPSNSLVDGLQTLDVAGLSLIIGRTAKSIKVDCFRRPESLPPRFIIPGSRKMLWRVCDVKDWMDALAARQAEQRRQAIELASRTGLKPADVARALSQYRRPKSQG
jgi:hypothetical protein